MKILSRVFSLLSVGFITLFFQLPLFGQDIDWSQVKPGQTIVTKEKKAVKAVKSKSTGKKVSKKSSKKTPVIIQEYDNKQRVDPYTGWNYIAKKNLETSEGCVSLSMKQSTGAFCLYNYRNGKSHPLLASYDSFCSTFFSLRVDDTVYKLNRYGGVECQPRLTPYGAQMAYCVEDLAYVVIDFSFMPSDAESPFVDAVRVSMYLVNISDKSHNFAIKGLFDTCLGENTDSHFTSSKERFLNTERQFRASEIKDAAWIRSADDFYSIQFIFSGKGVSEPYSLTLANKDALEKSSWIPSVQEGKGFSSVLSYNNSALAVNWNDCELAKKQMTIDTFYITVGELGKEPAGYDFIKALDEGRTVLRECTAPFIESLEKEAADKVDTKPSDPEKEDSRFWIGMPNISGPESEAWKSGAGQSLPKPEKTAEPSLEATPSVEKPEKENKESKVQVKKEQLDTEYIQALLQRIKNIEEGGEVIDESELKRLNDELDLILEKLRSND